MAGPDPNFRTVFDALPGASLLLAPDPPTFTILAATDAYLAATMITREQALGRGMFDVFPDPSPADARLAGAPDLRTSLETVLRTGEPHRMSDHRYDLRRADGTREVRWWAALNVPVAGEDGTVRYILHQAEDVTARASRGRFRQLAAVLERVTLAGSHDEVLATVRAGACELVGSAGSSLVVREGEECRYVTVQSPSGPLWTGRRYPLRACVAGWAMLHGRAAVVRDVLNDSRVTAELYAPTFVRSLIVVPVGLPEPFAAIGAYWDHVRHHDPEEVAVLAALARVAGEAMSRARADAEARAAETALHESEVRYGVLFDSLDAGFCVAEVCFEGDRAVDYRFLEVNRAFERQTGLAGAAGRRISELVPHYEEHWSEIFGHVVRTGERVRFQRPSQAFGDRWFDVDAFPVGAPEDRRVGMLFYDITDRVRSEERLREAGRLEAVGALAGGVAHEANNQMSVVLGFADFLLRREDLPAEARDDIEQMRRAAERTALVTGQLLAFGRRQVLRPAVLDLNANIAGIAPVLRRTLGVDTELVLAPGAALPPVLVDARQMEQVLLNLTLNARDAMPRGGRLTITTRTVVIGEGEADQPPPGRYVRLVVDDTGSGIDPSVRARIFEPFVTTKPVGQGTGLGLASVYGIVTQSGGYVRADDAPGGGARFVIDLPEAGSSAAAAPPDRALPAADRGGTVLVVEDDAAVRTMMVRTLASAGYRVLEAADGRAALALFAELDERPDLVITDVVMPQMSGPELADALASRHPGIPVLFVSGYVEAGRPAAAGAVRRGYLQKPMAPEELVRVVREVLAG